MVTPMAWSKNKDPAVPLRKMRGMKTEQVVSTEESMGMKTSLTAMTTEVSWQRPLCLMLSMTMMALSTIMPTPSMRPERDMMFMEMPMA